MTDIWWRCRPRKLVHWDGYYEHVSHYTYDVVWERLTVDHYTPKGVVLRRPFNTVFVLGTARKQYAVPTRELALQDAKIRANHHVAGCEHRLHIAKELRAVLEKESVDE